MREALEGDAHAIAYRSLSDALHGGEASAVAAFNQRLRKHFRSRSGASSSPALARPRG